MRNSRRATSAQPLGGRLNYLLTSRLASIYQYTSFPVTILNQTLSFTLLTELCEVLDKIHYKKVMSYCRGHKHVNNGPEIRPRIAKCTPILSSLQTLLYHCKVVVKPLLTSFLHVYLNLKTWSSLLVFGIRKHYSLIEGGLSGNLVVGAEKSRYSVFSITFAVVK